MTMLAEMVDAVIGIDTHEVEIADPAGKPIAVLPIGNDSTGFARPLAVIAGAAPGPLLYWPGVNYAPVPATSRPSGRLRSAVWRWPWARPGSSSPATAPNCWPTSGKSLSA
jgi:hypothetical protein